LRTGNDEDVVYSGKFRPKGLVQEERRPRRS